MGRIIDRRRVMGGESLPYYVEIEYLESTGTQWIDTGILALKTIDFEITGSINYNRATYDAAAGARNNNSGYGRFLFFSLMDSSYIRTIYSDTTLVANYNLGTKVNIKKNGSTAFLNDSKWGDLTATLEESNPKSIYLFSVNGYDAPAQWSASCTIYFLKIYNDGTLVRDFIPVRIGTTGYMYDKVSKQLFGNAGRGSFILGPDV